MVRQVKVVGILMIIHGITVIIMGGLVIFAGAWILGVGPAGGGGGGPDANVISVIYIAWGSLVLICGLLNAIAGVRIMMFHNRILGIVALFSNVLVLLTCYCALTAIGMMVYGLIVLFQRDVARAFEMVASGATPEEAIDRLTRSYGDVRDDYDDRSRSRRDWDDEFERRRDDLDARSDEDFDRRDRDPGS
jgi:hypothetical protein